MAGAIALESGVELGEIEVKARGYWEQVWRRFKRDKIAIGGGITIILLILVAFIGAPIAKSILGHCPDDPFYTAMDSPRQPLGPLALGSRPPPPCHYGLRLLGAC